MVVAEGIKLPAVILYDELPVWTHSGIRSSQVPESM